jgi:hypothetical protein
MAPVSNSSIRYSPTIKDHIPLSCKSTGKLLFGIFTPRNASDRNHRGYKPPAKGLAPVFFFTSRCSLYLINPRGASRFPCGFDSNCSSSALLLLVTFRFSMRGCVYVSKICIPRLLVTNNKE